MAKKAKTRTKKEIARTLGPVAEGPLARRAAVNRAINQKLLREQISAGQHHVHIVKALDEVAKLRQDISKKKKMTKEEQAAFLSKLQALKVSMDGHFRLLNKYLPDLRSMEFREGDGETNPFASAAKAWAEALSRDS